MRRRPVSKFRPHLERIEGRLLLSAAAQTAHNAVVKARSAAVTSQSSETPVSAGAAGESVTKRVAQVANPAGTPQQHLVNKFLAFRITNPKKTPVNLIPPFQQVLVQSAQPVPGQTYNLLQIALKNGTARTFDSSSGFSVRLNNGSKSQAFPILTGNMQWKPNQWFVFYVLSKKYYRVPFVAGGFQFDLGGASSTLVPGPSGIFLRLKYNPTTFASTLNHIVAFGQGAQIGKGPPFGMPVTSINEFVAANTRRNDYGGRF